MRVFVSWFPRSQMETAGRVRAMFCKRQPALGCGDSSPLFICAERFATTTRSALHAKAAIDRTHSKRRCEANALKGVQGFSRQRRLCGLKPWTPLLLRHADSQAVEGLGLTGDAGVVEHDESRIPEAGEADSVVRDLGGAQVLRAESACAARTERRLEGDIGGRAPPRTYFFFPFAIVSPAKMRKERGAPLTVLVTRFHPSRRFTGVGSVIFCFWCSE